MECREARLPLPWQTGDIGSPATAGAAGWASGVFVADGAGTDIGGNADQFRFIYQTLDGDGEVVARVDSLERTSPWAKAGIMIRDELTAGAKHASALVTPNRNALFQRRIANDAIAAQTVTAGDIPVWLKIVRKGNAFTTFRSSNGTTWTQIGSEVVYLKRLVYVGLVVTSRSARSLSTATFSNVVVTPIASTPNQPPTVSLTAPDNGATYTAPATMTVSASATDTDGTIAAVEFYAGGTSIGSDSSSPVLGDVERCPRGHPLADGRGPRQRGRDNDVERTADHDLGAIEQNARGDADQPGERRRVQLHRLRLRCRQPRAIATGRSHEWISLPAQRRSVRTSAVRILRRGRTHPPATMRSPRSPWTTPAPPSRRRLRRLR